MLLPMLGNVNDVPDISLQIYFYFYYEEI